MQELKYGNKLPVKIHSDDEPTLVAAGNELKAQGVGYETTAPGIHEAFDERGVRTVWEKARCTIRTRDRGHLFPPQSLKHLLQYVVLSEPDSEQEDRRSLTSFTRGRASDDVIKMQLPFGSFGVQAIARTSVRPAVLHCISLGRSAGSRGSKFTATLIGSRTRRRCGRSRLRQGRPLS